MRLLYNMEYNFKNKYLKYKKKYLLLSQSIKLGGTLSDQMVEYKKIIETKLIKYNINLEIFEEESKDINILIIESKEEHKEKMPVLVVLAGYSHNSFRGTADILINNIYELMKKFNKIYIIEYDSYKADQTSACSLRDNKIKKETDDINLIYKPEKDLNDKIAIRIDKIIRKELKLSHVHLLGKCAGAGVLIHTLVKDTKDFIYDALYLAVPGNPFNIMELKQISKEQLKKLKFIFSWTKQDVFAFDWGNTSIKEKDVYTKAMKELELIKQIHIDYTILEEDLKKEEDKKLYHEINQKLINAILLK